MQIALPYFPFAGSRTGGRLPLSTATKEAKCLKTALRCAFRSYVRESLKAVQNNSTESTGYLTLTKTEVFNLSGKAV